MLSIPDMALLGAAALMFFGPEQLPKVARKVGILVRDVQNTSQSFIREMERAADDQTYGTSDISRAHLIEDPVSAPVSYQAPAYEPLLHEQKHPWEMTTHEPSPPAAPASPHHDVMPVRAPSATADHDLPP